MTALQSGAEVLPVARGSSSRAKSAEQSKIGTLERAIVRLLDSEKNMGLVKQYLCDNCGKVLFGKKGVALVHETYLSIRGSITVQRWNDDTNRGEFVYISEHPAEPMCFCNTACLKEFAEHKVKQWDEEGGEMNRERVARLREEAEVEYQKRLRDEKRYEKP